MAGYNLTGSPITFLGLWPDGSNTGHTKAPGYPGSLSPGGAVTSGNTYDFLDYVGGLGLTGISNVTFNGCRFQSNDVDFANIILVNCTNIVFNYCSVTPLVSLHPTPTHPGVWPSAGAGLAVAGLTEAEFAPYMIDGDNGYQYGIRIGGGTGTAGTIIDHCDIWGFGNAIDFVGALDGIVRHTWIHDAANPVPQDYHTDGPGYLDGGGGRSNILIEHCTIATLGNTNAIALQNAGSPYSNITVQDCFLSGFGYTVDMCHNVSGNNNLTFLDNVFGTDIRWGFGPIYADFTAQFAEASNLWHGNRLQVLPGTSPGAGTSPAWTSADNGKYVWPDGSLHADDFEADADNVTLTAAGGSYAVTGSAAAFLTSSNVTLPAAAGGYTLTGSAATFAIAAGSFTLFCGSGSYALSGSEVSFPGYDPAPPVQPSTGGSGYAGAWSGPKRRKRKRDEIEELIDAVIQAPPIVRQTPLSEPPPPPASAREDGRLRPYALVDLMPKMQAVGLTPPQRKIIKRAIVTDDPDDDEEAITLLLNLLS